MGKRRWLVVPTNDVSGTVLTAFSPVAAPDNRGREGSGNRTAGCIDCLYRAHLTLLFFRFQSYRFCTL